MTGPISAPRLTVCTIGDAASPHEYNWSEAIARQGCDVIMLSPRPRADARIHVRVIPLATSRIWLVRHLVNLWRWCRAVAGMPADIFHAHYASDYGPWALGLLGRGPVALTAMGSDILHAARGDMGPLTRWLTRRVLRRAELVVSHSRHVAEVAVSQGARCSSVHISLWGVDLRTFARDDGAGDAQRKSWGLSPQHFVVLSPRSLDPIYCQDAIVAGIAEGADDARPAALVIPVRNRADPRAADLSTFAARVGVDLRLVDALDHAGMPAAYSAADAVISMALSDNVPRTILEAMACRTPVIARNLPDLKGLVIDGRHAILVDGTPATIGRAIKALSADEALCRRLADAGREFAERNADLDRDTRAIVDRYRLILGRPDAGGAGGRAETAQ